MYIVSKMTINCQGPVSSQLYDSCYEGQYVVSYMTVAAKGQYQVSYTKSLQGSVLCRKRQSNYKRNAKNYGFISTKASVKKTKLVINCRSFPGKDLFQVSNTTAIAKDLYRVAANGVYQ